jgi:hypothetical protein
MENGNWGVLGSIPRQGKRDDRFFQLLGWELFSMISSTATFLVRASLANVGLIPLFTE